MSLLYALLVMSVVAALGGAVDEENANSDSSVMTGIDNLFSGEVGIQLNEPFPGGLTADSSTFKCCDSKGMVSRATVDREVSGKYTFQWKCNKLEMVVHKFQIGDRPLVEYVKMTILPPNNEILKYSVSGPDKAFHDDNKFEVKLEKEDILDIADKGDTEEIAGTKDISGKVDNPGVDLKKMLKEFVRNCISKAGESVKDAISSQGDLIVDRRTLVVSIPEADSDVPLG